MHPENLIHPDVRQRNQTAMPENELEVLLSAWNTD